jgi:hypothetical protein
MDVMPGATVQWLLYHFVKIHKPPLDIQPDIKVLAVPSSGTVLVEQSQPIINTSKVLKRFKKIRNFDQICSRYTCIYMLFNLLVR